TSTSSSGFTYHAITVAILAIYTNPLWCIAAAKYAEGAAVLRIESEHAALVDSPAYTDDAITACRFTYDPTSSTPADSVDPVKIDGTRFWWSVWNFQYN